MSSHAPWWISAVWLTLTLLTALAVDASSVRGWMLTLAIGIVPGAILLRLWSDGPPLTVAEVIRSTEQRR